MKQSVYKYGTYALMTCLFITNNAWSRGTINLSEDILSGNPEWMLEGIEEIPNNFSIFSRDDLFTEATSDNLDPLENDQGDLNSTAIALPKKRVLVGTKTLTCVGIKWKDIENPIATAEACQNLANNISDFYFKNSRGLFKITPTAGYSLEVPYIGHNRNLAAAEAMVKDAYKADMYIIPSKFTYPHASNKIAHVKSAQFMTAAHEVGHLLGLGHAGSYNYSADGKPTLNAYGDKRSIMGSTYSRFISAPQYYYLGWLPAKEVVLYDKTPANFTLKKISDFNVNGTATVVVPPEVTGGRYAFISLNTCTRQSGNCVFLHLSTGGGSQKVAEVQTEYYDENFTGLHIKVVSQKNSRATISLDYDKKP